MNGDYIISTAMKRQYHEDLKNRAWEQFAEGLPAMRRAPADIARDRLRSIIRRDREAVPANRWVKVRGRTSPFAIPSIPTTECPWTEWRRERKAKYRWERRR